MFVMVRTDSNILIHLSSLKSSQLIYKISNIKMGIEANTNMAMTFETKPSTILENQGTLKTRRRTSELGYHIDSRACLVMPSHIESLSFLRKNVNASPKPSNTEKKLGSL